MLISNQWIRRDVAGSSRGLVCEKCLSIWLMNTMRNWVKTDGQKPCLRQSKAVIPAECNICVSSSNSRTAQKSSVMPEIFTVTKLILSNSMVKGFCCSRIKYSITVTVKNTDWYVSPDVLNYLCTYSVIYYHEFIIMSYPQNAIHLGWNPIVYSLCTTCFGPLVPLPRSVK